jgi:cobalt-zinc-cadmium resistance protein CzcA
MEALKPNLPKGIKIIPFYDRSDLITKAVHNVEKALTEAVILVLIVLVVMLGNLRSALTVAMILPLSVLFTFIMMRLTGVSANVCRDMTDMYLVQDSKKLTSSV